VGIVHLSDNEFSKEVLQSKQPVLVDFWAPWCAPCKMIAPILDGISQEYEGRLKVCKIDIDKNQGAAAKYQVLSIPTLLFFKDGKVATQLMGVRPEAEIKKTVDSLIAQSSG
jgi:thioredoxin 1